MTGYFSSLMMPRSFFGMSAGSLSDDLVNRLLYRNLARYDGTNEGGAILPPQIDPNMPVFAPPPNILLKMPVIRAIEELPPAEVPPYVDEKGNLVLDGKNPKRNPTRITPGRPT